MKTNQILGIVGGALMIIGTVIPSMGITLWTMMGLASFLGLIAYMAPVAAITGAAGAFFSWKGDKKSSMIALVCGAACILFMLIGSKFSFELFRSLQFILIVLGSILMIAGGAMGMKAQA
jgi:hypothetical protein